jgi:cobyrinic acid a,c-diamide synthase
MTERRTSALANCPALFIAAPASGQGKTTVTAALARLHAREGKRVRIFKCGPDFLDPQILAVASGAPVLNLDLWMCGEADCARRLADAASMAELILVEGVMGLYDAEPSGADIAQRFGLPVLAVIDAAAMAQTFGALALGLKNYGPSLAFAGVLANAVGGDAHAGMLRESLPADIAWHGHLPRDPAATLPERHLGLAQAGEIGDLLARLDRLADQLAATGMASLPTPVAFRASPVTAPPPVLAGRIIAIARDAAFAFIYPANLDCLEALGARLVFFSPLADTAVPDADALWLPGGYPELHAAQLSANGSMLASLRAHHAAGKPMLAECGGMMALFDTLIDCDGAGHAMAGLLPGETAMQARLAALGLQQAALPEGQLRGHTFHYSRATSSLAPLTRAVTSRGGQGEAVYRRGRLTASYVHFYFPSDPLAAARLFLP